MYASRHDDLFLTSQNIQEFRRFVQEKKPTLQQAAETLLDELTYEWLPMVHKGTTQMRDETDQPILNTAIAANVDVILTGDKDFLVLKLTKPACVSPMEYLVKVYMESCKDLLIELALCTLSRIRTQAKSKMSVTVSEDEFWELFSAKA